MIGTMELNQIDFLQKIVTKAYEKENVGLHVLRSDGTFGVVGSVIRVPLHERPSEATKGQPRATVVQPIAYVADDDECDCPRDFGAAQQRLEDVG